MRQLRSEEAAIIKQLLDMAHSSTRPNFRSDSFVDDMNDGGMGSIRFVDELDRHRKMARELVIAEYIDEDEIPVLISINLDEDGQIFELDIWKVNYQSLKRYPQPQQLHTAPAPSTDTQIRRAE